MDAQEHKKTSSIGQLAREFGVSLRTLRFYEDRGLLIPHRKGTVRRYDEQHKTRLSMILKAKQLGFILPRYERSSSAGKRTLRIPLSFRSLPKRSIGRSCTWKRKSGRSSAPFRSSRRGAKQVLATPERRQQKRLSCTAAKILSCLRGPLPTWSAA